MYGIYGILSILLFETSGLGFWDNPLSPYLKMFGILGLAYGTVY